MPGNFKSVDLRVKKTRKAMTEAMYTLLNKRKFCNITVNDLCEEALISRPTFYLHFQSKYDLLKYTLNDLENICLKPENNDTDILQIATLFVSQNIKLIKNLIIDANAETSDMVDDFILSIVKTISVNKDTHPKEQYVYSFIVGGIHNLFLLYLHSKLSTDPMPVDVFVSKLFEVTCYMMKWNKT